MDDLPCSIQEVRNMKAIKLKKLPKYYKYCDKCGNLFKRNSGIQKYCFKCTTVTCKECGKEYRHPGTIINKFCSRKCFDDFRRGKEFQGKKTKISKSGRNKINTSIRKKWQGKDREELTKKISEATKKAMQRPEVQKKIRADRKPLTKSHKEKVSRALEGKMPVNIEGIFKEGKYTSKFGWLEIGGQRHYMRSSWERNIGRYLEWLKEKDEIKAWDYECKRFFFEKIRCGNRSYLPDFKVYENDGGYYWIEVKGYMTQSAKTKLRRMQRYFPEEIIQMLDAKQYEALRKELRNLVPDWE